MLGIFDNQKHAEDCIETPGEFKKGEYSQGRPSFLFFRGGVERKIRGDIVYSAWKKWRDTK